MLLYYQFISADQKTKNSENWSINTWSSWPINIKNIKNYKNNIGSRRKLPPQFRESWQNCPEYIGWQYPREYNFFLLKLEAAIMTISLTVGWAEVLNHSEAITSKSSNNSNAGNDILVQQYWKMLVCLIRFNLKFGRTILLTFLLCFQRKNKQNGKFSIGDDELKKKMEQVILPSTNLQMI